ncbi:MAG: hypothetical protein KME64_36645 [Scytonematopsis contorta HA4267-MV1]|nr:hypothetical protein [Scytonematopsis contorta HA4267-MV1]
MIKVRGRIRLSHELSFFLNAWGFRKAQALSTGILDTHVIEAVKFA